MDVQKELGTSRSGNPRKGEEEKRRSANPAEETAPRNTKKARILVIEDQDAIRSFLQRFLIRLGHFVIAAANGEEGLAAAQGGKFDLVISDMIMPGMTGFETFKRIRGIDPMVKAIFLSGTEDLNRNQEFLDLKQKGVAVFLSKPFRVKEIEILLQMMLED